MNYVYDAHGNVTSMTDRNGRVTDYTYDDLHRLVLEDWYATSARTTQANHIIYHYDAEGNLSSIVDDFSAYSFVYDDIYRLTRETGSNSLTTPGAVDVTLDYTYDNASNRLTMTETINGTPGNGITTNYDYDRLNRLVGMDQAGDPTSTGANKSIAIDYDALGLVTELRRYSNLTQDGSGNGLRSRSNFSYDGLNRITDIDHRDRNNNIVAFYDYQYDGVGNLTGQTDTDGSIIFNVNARNEVTVADYGAGDVRSDESYNYDATSDLSSRNGSSFTEGDDNEVTSDGTYTYQYDDEGNLVLQTLIADGSYREFTYDHRNRLTSATDRTVGGVITSSVTYVYDALNRRILKDDGTTQTSYAYDGSDVQLEFVNGVLTIRYFQGLGIDDVFAEENVGESWKPAVDWLLVDRQGTVKDVLDRAGDLAQHLVFDTYGNLLEITDGVGSVQTINDLLTEYGFTSRRYETETGLWYFRARYYNSELGRFISRDPLGFVDGPSQYTAYFASLWMVDPTGEGLIEWAYTGMWNPPPGVYNAAVQGAADYLLGNGGSGASFKAGNSKGGAYAEGSYSIKFMNPQTGKVEFWNSKIDTNLEFDALRAKGMGMGDMRVLGASLKFEASPKQGFDLDIEAHGIEHVYESDCTCFMIGGEPYYVKFRNTISTLKGEAGLGLDWNIRDGSVGANANLRAFMKGWQRGIAVGHKKYGGVYAEGELTLVGVGGKAGAYVDLFGKKNKKGKGRKHTGAEAKWNTGPVGGGIKVKAVASDC